MSKKKIISLSLVVIMIAILSFGTLAWFNDSDSVTNEFHVADSNGDGTPDFSVSVTESTTDENGEKPGTPNADGGYSYDLLLPGDTLSKIVWTENTGDYNQWVRVNITISDWSVWKKAIVKALTAEGETDTGDANINDYVYTKLLDGFDRSLYLSKGYRNDDTANDTRTYTLYYKDVVKPGDAFQVMQNVKIPGVLEQEDMNFGTDGFTITVKAEAVQADNLKATSSVAAFEEVGWEIGAEYGA